LIILKLAAIFALSAVVSAEQQKTVNNGIVTGSEVQTVTKHGYSITVHKCWSVSGDDNQYEELDDRNIWPTNKCPPAERGTWSMGTAFNFLGISTIDDYWRVERGRPGRITYETKVNVDGQLVVLVQRVDPENRLIDRKDQKNLVWQTIVECKGKFVSIGYGDYLDKPARENARKMHVIPRIFKEFLDGFKCDKKMM